MSSKGKRRERQAADLYERAGFETFRPQESKYGETDIFGLFDLVAVHPYRPTHWVQVKSNGADGINEWSEAAIECIDPCRDVIAYLVCYDREGWRFIRRWEKSHVDEVDERPLSCDMGERVATHLECAYA